MTEQSRREKEMAERVIIAVLQMLEDYAKWARGMKARGIVP